MLQKTFTYFPVLTVMAHIFPQVLIYQVMQFGKLKMNIIHQGLTGLLQNFMQTWTCQTYLPRLRFRSETGIDELNQMENQFDFRNVTKLQSTSNAWDRHTNVLHWTTNNYFTYDYKIGESQNFNFTLGNSSEDSKTGGFGLNGYNFSNDFFTSPGNAASGDQSGLCI